MKLLGIGSPVSVDVGKVRRLIIMGSVPLSLLAFHVMVWADPIVPDKRTPYGPEHLYIEKAKTMLQRGEWRFDQDQAGVAPKGFSAVTVGGNGAGTWQVAADDQAPSPPYVLTQTKPCSGKGCFQILRAENLAYDYVDIIFRIRPLKDKQSGIGGTIFSVKDAENFYAALVDFSKDSLSIVRVLSGKETVLGTAPIVRKHDRWHSIRVQRNTNLSNDFIESFFDNKLAVSVQDQSLGKGGVGLVTRGSAPVGFDNLKTIRIFSQRPLSPPAAY